MAAVGDLEVGTVFQYGGQRYTVIEKRSGLGPTVQRENGAINNFGAHSTIVTVVPPPEPPKSIPDRYPEYSFLRFNFYQYQDDPNTDEMTRHINTMVYDGYELVSITPLDSLTVLVTMMKY